MTEEFNLSERVKNNKKGDRHILDKEWIHKDDVKEFIRLLKEDINFFAEDPYDGFDLQIAEMIRCHINKLAGDELV